MGIYYHVHVLAQFHLLSMDLKIKYADVLPLCNSKTKFEIVSASSDSSLGPLSYSIPLIFYNFNNLAHSMKRFFNQSCLPYRQSQINHQSDTLLL